MRAEGRGGTRGGDGNRGSKRAGWDMRGDRQRKGSAAAAVRRGEDIAAEDKRARGAEGNM